MKTITFYSYKGGVGRSLALRETAKRLSEFGKKVCVLDFDLEAPGLTFKFSNYGWTKDLSIGIVDYIYDYAHDNNLPKSISGYSIQLNPPNALHKPIDFIPCGDFSKQEYWKKLSAINWSELLYEREGIKFFLDLKAKIEKELNPDCLLIDSRTGITDISGITLKLLSDQIVILAINNRENIEGSKLIIKNLLDNSNSLFESTPKISFVLSRLPFTSDGRERSQEFSVLQRLKDNFQIELKKDFDILTIHREKRLEINENLPINYDEEDDRSEDRKEMQEQKISISADYMNLFYSLTSDILTKDEIDKFKNSKRAEKEFKKVFATSDYAKRIEFLNKAIELNPTNDAYFLERGHSYYQIKDFEKALQNFNQVIKLNPKNSFAYNNLGAILVNQNDFDKAMEYYNKAIELNPIEPLPYLNRIGLFAKQSNYDEGLRVATEYLDKVDANDPSILNIRADLYRRVGNFKSAYKDIYAAIEADSETGVPFATLAEIYASENKMEEFYNNLAIALSKGISVENLKEVMDVYANFQKDERFISLMKKYEIDLDELFEIKD